MIRRPSSLSFFFFNDTATTEIYTLSLHDALPISAQRHREDADVDRVGERVLVVVAQRREAHQGRLVVQHLVDRSEEHTSELQSRLHLVCRLLLEKKKPHQIEPRSATSKDTRPESD